MNMEMIAPPHKTGSSSSAAIAPDLAKAAKLIEKLRSEMYAHILKEEQVLFPFISQMDWRFHRLKQCRRVKQADFSGSQAFAESQLRDK